MIITIIVLAVLAAIIAVLVIITRQRMKTLGNVKENEKIHVLTDQNFRHKLKSGMVLVDFWASWCMPCKMMVPVLNDVAEEAGNKVLIGKVNVDEAKATAAAFGIRSIPTMILFKNGKEIHRFTGVKTKEYILREIDRRSMN
jgi:thioredoxin 1